ncbi:MAG: hypothetical protein K2P84_11000, partial [Undibacterium sp.]|nr:hypothetical protein [Undibacterium sp.]
DKAVKNLILKAKENGGNQAWLAVNREPLTDKTLQGQVVTFTDISLLKQQEAALIKDNEELELRVVQRTQELERSNRHLQQTLLDLHETQKALLHQEKNAALGRMTISIAHELNTPIGNSLTMSSTILEEARSLKAEMEGVGVRKSSVENFLNMSIKGGEILDRSLQKMSHFISELKQVILKQGISHHSHFDVSRVLANLQDQVQPILREARVDMHISAPSELPIHSYQLELELVLKQLISNALEHGLKATHDGAIHIEVRDLGSELEISVQDNGRGVPNEHAERIFEAFFTTNMGSHKGLGLNQAVNLTKHVLEGRIVLDTNNLEGARFVLTLPREVSVKV